MLGPLGQALDLDTHSQQQTGEFFSAGGDQPGGDLLVAGHHLD
jgi:hypothetical protein